MRNSAPGRALIATAAATALALIRLVSAAESSDQIFVPASSVPGATSPVIHRDGSVTFTLNAPDAQSVQLAGGDGLGHGPFALTKGGDGTWSVTISPPVPGFHYYWFIVDGAAMNDPASETYFGYGKETSGIEIPEAGSDFYSIKTVPHGEVREHWYWSKITGSWRRALVYTPPDYDKTRSRRYPLLILQHGAGENETGWTRQGRAQFILDNLIASGKAKPMIVAMDRGYADRVGMPPLQFSPETTVDQVRVEFSAFEDVVLNELMPTIDAHYRTIPDRGHRALAGLSMGGMETLYIALHHLDRFAYIASMSGPIIRPSGAGTSLADRLTGPFDTRLAFDGAFADPTRFNKRVRLLWMGLGTAEPDTFMASVGSAISALTTSGVRLVYFESPGTAHEWQTWRRDLYDLAPRLFR